MTTNEFTLLVEEMRAKQRLFAQTPQDHADYGVRLFFANQAERRVDQALETIHTQDIYVTVKGGGGPVFVDSPI